MQKVHNISRLLLLLIVLLGYSCVQKTDNSAKDPTIKIREAAEPSSINPFFIRDEIGYYLAGQIFQPLLAVDYQSEELVGVLAEGRPMISSTEDWKMVIEYRLRENVRFNDGSPLSIKDILYSIKSSICPLVNPYFSNYYQFIDSVAIDARDSNVFRFYSNETYFLSEYTSGDYYILSEEQFDPDHLLRKFNLNELKQITKEADNEELAAYASFIESINFKDSLQPIGSGAYQLKEWRNGEKISLVPVQEWWGNELEEKNTYLASNSNEIDFYFIEDAITAINALKNRELDLMRSIPASRYKDLSENADFAKNFDLKEASKLGFQYLGFNMRKEETSKLELRKAIAFSLPQDDIIDKLYYGYAKNSCSMLDYEETHLQLFNKYTFSEDSARYYLQQYKSKYGNEEISLTYAYNSGNDSREATALILKESLSKLGIELNIEQYEWTVYLKKLRAGEFDLFMNGTVTSTITPDLSNSFHSNSINGGRNYSAFNNPKGDSLLNAIAEELDQEKREKLFVEFELLVNREIPILILMKPLELMAYSKNLKNAQAYRLRPNYWVAEMSK